MDQPEKRGEPQCVTCILPSPDVIFENCICGLNQQNNHYYIRGIIRVDAWEIKNIKHSEKAAPSKSCQHH